jgi:2-polyprenyl-3-methyl-5-hydroxy-6-metoxy-1,4-benzoquinol methylase
MNPTDQQRHCPVCGLAQARPWIRKGQLTLVRCPCGMVYADPIPAEYATGDYYHREAAAYYLSPAKLAADYSDVRFERELGIFRRHCAKGAVLDVGCSSGAFLWQLKEHCPGAYQILGTDVSGPALDYAESRGVPVIRGDFLDQPLSSLDAVTFWAVLEHVADPGAFLAKAATLLRPEGRCFVLVPNTRSLAMRLLGKKYRYVYPQHLNYFDRKTLIQLVRRHFQVLEIQYTHFNPLILWQDWRRGGREVSNDERASLLQRTTGYKKNPALKPLKWAYKIVESTLAGVRLADNLLVVLAKL